MAVAVHGPPPLRVARHQATPAADGPGSDVQVQRVRHGEPAVINGEYVSSRTTASTRTGSLFIFGNDVHSSAGGSMSIGGASASTSVPLYDVSATANGLAAGHDPSLDAAAEAKSQQKSDPLSHLAGDAESTEPDSPHSGSTDTESITGTLLHRRETPVPDLTASRNSPWTAEFESESSASLPDASSSRTRASVAALLRSRPPRESLRRHTVSHVPAMPVGEVGSTPTEPEVEPLEARFAPGQFPRTPQRMEQTLNSVLVGETPLPSWAVRCLDEAQGLAVQRCFADGIRSVLPVLSGPQRALELLESLCISWEKSDQDRGRKHDVDVGQLTAELVQAREESDAACLGLQDELEVERKNRQRIERRMLHQANDSKTLMAETASLRERADAWKRLKEEKDLELASERQKLQDMQREIAWLKRRSQVQDEVLRENAQLKQQLRNAESSAATQATVQSRSELVRQLAELECTPLRQCGGDERAALRKKILVKWHPDKQPCDGHASLATQVMQELQNHPAWDL